MFIASEVKQRLVALGVIRSGHFVLASGLHSQQYLNKNAIFARPEDLSRLCMELALRVASSRPAAVIGPTVGGALIAQFTALHLGRGLEETPLALFADKQTDGSVELRRGFGPLVEGKTVAVVEDVIMTGGSARKVVDAVRAAGGRVACVAAICNRGGVLGFDDVDRFCVLVEFTMDKYEPGACPLCASGVPVDTEFGRGPAS